MRNRILHLTRSVIPYVKELQPLAYSVAGCILMQQLDYWFERYSDGFYKFMEPSEHPRYKSGESWCEELGVSSEEFRTAFDKIGIRFKSKSQFDQTEDKFQGKFYCSYLDRRTNLTYYFRNHPHLDKALDALITSRKDTRAPAGGGQRDRESAAQPSASGGLKRGVTVKPKPPVTVNRDSRFTVSRESQDTGNRQSEVTQTGIPNSQETGKVDVVSTEITGSKITQKLQPRLRTAGSNVEDTSKAAGCGDDELVFPKNLLDEERVEVANMLRNCPDALRQKVLDEIEGAIRGKTIQKGPVPFCRALIRAVQMGTFNANLGVAVLARRQADTRYRERLAPAPTVEDIERGEAARKEAGAAMLARIRARRSEKTDARQRHR